MFLKTLADYLFVVWGGVETESFVPACAIVLTALLIPYFIFLVQRLRSLSWQDSFCQLGYKKPHGTQLLIGFLSLAPCAFCTLIGFLGGLYKFKSMSVLFFVAVVLVAGFLEETFFRGFLFQLLRPGRSLVRASVLSGLLWAAYHITNYRMGRSFDGWLFAGNVFVSLILMFPNAYLFERGGNVIWGPMITHVGYDLVTFFVSFQKGDYVFLALLLRIFGAVSTAVFAGVLTYGFLPVGLGEKAVRGNSTKTKIRFENKESANLARYLLPAACVLITSLFLFPTGKSLKEEREIAKYQQLIKDHPDRYYGYELLGIEYYQLGRFSEAVPNLQKAIQLNPKASLSYVTWGDCLSTWKDYGEAILKYRKAVEISPDSYLAYLSWGHTLQQMGKNEEALRKFEKVVELPNTDDLSKKDAEGKIAYLKKLKH